MREADLTVGGLAFEEMGIEELVSLAREAGLVELEELSCRGSGAVVQIDLQRRIDEPTLDSLAYVEEWTHVTERDDTHVYVIAFTAPGLPEEMQDTAAELVGTCDPDIEGSETNFSLVGSQEAIADTISEYERAGISPDLRTLADYEGPARPLDALTERQHKVIETAWDLGYYEIPREAATEDIADELDVDPSTVTEHLQRAERNLLGTVL